MQIDIFSRTLFLAGAREKNVAALKVMGIVEKLQYGPTDLGEQKSCALENQQFSSLPKHFLALHIFFRQGGEMSKVNCTKGCCCISDKKVEHLCMPPCSANKKGIIIR